MGDLRGPVLPEENDAERSVTDFGLGTLYEEGWPRAGVDLLEKHGVWQRNMPIDTDSGQCVAG